MTDAPLRILCVHNRYLIRGGEDLAFEDEQRMLREHGHAVTGYERDNQDVAQVGRIRLFGKTIWSVQTYHEVRRYLRRERFDVMHVHNTLPLISPSVYYAAKSVGVPVVQTLHNYRLICPNASLYRDGGICEACVGKTVAWPGIVHACYRDSRLASGAVATLMATHKVMRTWSRAVQRYIVPSRFGRDKLIEGGLPADRVVVKPPYVTPDPGVGPGGEYALFVGRLDPQKGADVMIDAWRQLGGEIPLKIVGDGPLREKIEQAAQRLSGVEYLGRRERAEVDELMGNARIFLFPSTWYEGLPRVILEALARGTPVVTSGIGSMASVIDDGRTGLHFRAGDVDHLVERVRWVLANPDEVAAMRCHARDEFEATYTPQANYTRLMEIYASVLRPQPTVQPLG